MCIPVRNKISYEELSRIVELREDGRLYWKVKRSNKVLAGQLVKGSPRRLGYKAVCITVNKKREYILYHRLVFILHKGYDPENVIDHIDRNPKNNHPSNLREVSLACNNFNRGVQKNNLCGITGVSYRAKQQKYYVRIGINKRVICIGTFDNLTDAVIARYNAEVDFNIFKCCSSSPAYQYLLAQGDIRFMNSRHAVKLVPLVA